MPVAAPARPTVPPGPCSITGTVKYAGPPVVNAPPDGQCCPGVPKPADEHVVVNPDGTLRNVIVYVTDGPNVSGPPPGKTVLAQDGCRYDPHVFALRTGQTLVVTNHDPTLHNIHIQPTENPEQNFGEDRGQARSVTFDHADPAVDFKCDVHPWMRAFAMVFDHPDYAVTGDGGRFDIGRLPPGTYTVVARHERFGDLTQSVTVTAGKPTAQITFEFQP